MSISNKYQDFDNHSLESILDTKRNRKFTIR